MKVGDLRKILQGIDDNDEIVLKGYDWEFGTIEFRMILQTESAKGVFFIHDETMSQD